VQRALQSGAARATLTPPEPAPVDSTLLLVRCAALRLDAVVDARDEPVSHKESVDALVDRLSAIAVDGVARYMVPPGATLHAATPMDLGNLSALEDTPVWSEPVVEAIEQLALQGGGATRVVVQAMGDMVGGRARHPHLIEGGAATWRLRLHALPPLEASDTLSGAESPRPLPATVADTLQMMETRSDRERSLTWALSARLRSIVWNVDRVVQLLLLLQAERWAGTGVDGEPPHAPYVPVQLVVPSEWTTAQRAALAVAVAVAHAVARQQHGVMWRIDLRSSGSDSDAAVRGALATARRAFVDEYAPSVAPLCEVALALAAVLD